MRMAPGTEEGRGLAEPLLSVRRDYLDLTHPGSISRISAHMLHTLKPAPGSTKKRKRVARGNSAGGGTTAGRGTKGQQSRVGKGRKFGFEGGQVPLIRRQPKAGGFKRHRKTEYEIINLDVLEQKLDAGTYDVAALRVARVVRSPRPVKFLAGESLTKKFVLSAHAASAGAKAAIEKAGGSLTILKPQC